MRKRDRTCEEKKFDSMLKSGLMRLGERPGTEPQTPHPEVPDPQQAANPFPYILVWDRLGRKGQRFRVINPKPKARIVHVEFEDGFRCSLSRQAIRRSD